MADAAPDQDDHPEPADLGDEDMHAPADLVELHEVLAWNEAVEEGSDG